MNSILLVRTYSSNTSCTIRKSAKIIRNEFLDYFRKDLGHTFIRSSPVVPLNDHTVAFVNAGMCQFKGVFLNYYDHPAMKVTNSQKCIRVSGKHNDLNVVGNDTYHHTFFEMLGNWSFGSYFKEEACHYAWDLLTKHYGINKEFLYVTYFGGDEKLELKPDLECKDIWLSIGVPKEKVLPFGLQENFWEMGISGPCGPCTEIHVDHTKQFTNRSMQVNKGLTNLTELWNIVFIQYVRLADGTITPLSKQQVDTGMGFERLVALLQGKDSNYDTDIFQPLFKTIQKYAKVPEYKGKFYNDIDGLDSGYRILADHSRMITVALADGMVPEKSNKLRRIIRKSVDISEKVFKKQGILLELSYAVAESLGDVYPELHENLKMVQKIIGFEEELYIKLQRTSDKQWKKICETRSQLKLVTDWVAPGLLDGYNYLQHAIYNLNITNVLPGNVAFKLYDTYGLHAKTIDELAKIESLYFDEATLQTELENLKNRSRIGILQSSVTALEESVKLFEKNDVPKTDDSFKYEYVFDGNSYQFPKVEGKIVGVIVNENVILSKANESANEYICPTVDETIANCSAKLNKNYIGIVLDKTVCYSVEGGQTSDKGSICIKDLTFSITDVRKINGYVIHYGNFLQSDLKKQNEEFKIGDHCVVSIIPEFRIELMQHHTGAHLLNACLKQIMKAVYPRNSRIFPHSLKFLYNSFGEKPSLEQLQEIEKVINNVIRANVPVTTRVLNALELLAEDFVTLTPGEIYPYKDIRVVEIDFHDLKSKEACCGTHVSKTGILEYFCFLDYFSKGASNFKIEAAVGSHATLAKLAGEKLQSKILDLENKLRSEKLAYQAFRSISNEIKDEIKVSKEVSVPYVIEEECLMKLNNLDKLARSQTK
ncbi:Alanine--tRNA ligase, mitochondrial [Habropoda laboriosa]|uniref:Alanine--tRNA ligase n=1 Tax=Habropoda laboriosa TaxID=597456 RepID=A0A0L7R3K3_9HYME|nr:PREDICTED: alanine--tRNA ligase, mitochondrial [Habropoda laboriosa]KOC65413.1 Alanine--tRNA ligase, mitochondrial [Habropoda laboriosa]